MEVEIFRESKPISLIINDFNAYHNEFDQSNTKLLMRPNYIPGVLLGTKIHKRQNEFGGNIQYMQFSTSGEGINADGKNYMQTLIISHSGICINYVFNLISTNYFRTGPGFSVNIDQYRFKNKIEEGNAYFNDIPTNRAILTGRLNYKISVGGPKFNIDIIAFYKLPIQNINLEKLNQNLNIGYATEYNNDELVFNPSTYGLTITVCVGSKENYDF
ncbi:MAG: hypothetical protein PHW82_10080 [Bacteroidales bacterium]|nr:hypothetical protein [Bacteroidales bacterium]